MNILLSLEINVSLNHPQRFPLGTNTKTKDPQLKNVPRIKTLVLSPKKEKCSSKSVPSESYVREEGGRWLEPDGLHDSKETVSRHKTGRLINIWTHRDCVSMHSAFTVSSQMESQCWEEVDISSHPNQEAISSWHLLAEQILVFSNGYVNHSYWPHAQK